MLQPRHLDQGFVVDGHRCAVHLIRQAAYATGHCELRLDVPTGHLGQKNRAIAETSCAVHTTLKLEGCEVLNISYTRLLWRVERLNGQWLIAGLRGIYIRDTLQTSGPNLELKIDEKKFASFRISYRYPG